VNMTLGGRADVELPLGGVEQHDYPTATVLNMALLYIMAVL